MASRWAVLGPGMALALGCGEAATVEDPSSEPPPAAAEIPPQPSPSADAHQCPHVPLAERMSHRMVELCEQAVVEPMQQTAHFDTALVGHWSGEYVGEEDGATATRFEAELAVVGGHVGGSITEPNTFGPAYLHELSSTVTGDVFATGQVVLLKQYDSGPIDHAVLYVGALDASRRRIEGRWRLPRRQGAFFMTKE